MAIIKNLKFKIKNLKLRRGFTLIEMLVVVGIIAIMSTFLLNLMFTTIKSNAKSEIIKSVKQNGDYVLGVMGYFIRNSKTLDPADCTGSQFSVVMDDENETVFSCSGVGTDDGYIASNSARMTGTKVTLSLCSLTCSQTGNSAPAVSISFTLTNLSTATKKEDQASTNFSTTVSARTY